MQREQDNCEHKLETVLCRKCGAHMVAHEEEVLGILTEIAGYCPNEDCDFYQVLIA